MLNLKLKKLNLLLKNNIFKRLYTNRNILKLNERGIFKDLFPDTSANDIVNLLNSKPQTVYAGFDPTSDSLHVGNLLVLIALLHWQRAGHNVIALVGGATAQVGDPSGRKAEREEISLDLVEQNSNSIQKQIQAIFKNHEKYFWESNDKLAPIQIINNIDWYKNMSSIEFISKIARNFRMGQLLCRTSVKERLNSPTGMSCAEFTYQLFQAYDWLHLLKNYKCRFQIGGQDQLGNIKSGHILIQKFIDKPVYGLLVPIITSESGEKLGKSAGNAIWLDSNKTSAFQFYQYWIRQKDIDALRLLKLFTFLDQNELQHFEKLQREVPNERLALTQLAEKVTLLIHGENGLESAKRITEALYKGSGGLDSIKKLNLNELEETFHGARVVEILCEPGLTILDLAMHSKCFNTKHDAVRIISAGGFYINQNRVDNLNEVIIPGMHILPNNATLIRVGKRNYCIVKWIT